MTAIFFVTALCAGLISCIHLAGKPSLSRILRVGFTTGFCFCLLFAAIPGLVSVMVEGSLGENCNLWFVALLEQGLVGGVVSAVTALILLRLTKS
jgi:hypothetical protein